MKTYSTILIIGALALAVGGCGTAYQAQTPDAVYYSPSQNNAGYASSSAVNSNQEAVTDNSDPNAGNYVTYDDGDYNNSSNYSYLNYPGYNTQALNLSANPGNFYAYNSFMMGSPMMYSPYYLGSPYSMGLGYSPFLGSYPSLSLGLGLGYSWGNPWMGGLYNPYSFGGLYSPYYYSPYMMGYGGYYGGGYGYYGYDKLGNYTPRPASAYGPRRSSNSSVYMGDGNTTTINGSAPVRTFGNTNTGNARTNTNRFGSERVFTTNPNEHPENLNTNTRVAEKKPSILRMFQRNNNNNYVEPRRNNQEIYRPQQQERTFSRPERTFEQSPRVEVSTPSYNNSGSAPARTFSPRGH